MYTKRIPVSSMSATMLVAAGAFHACLMAVGVGGCASVHPTRSSGSAHGETVLSTNLDRRYDFLALLVQVDREGAELYHSSWSGLLIEQVWADEMPIPPVSVEVSDPGGGILRVTKPAEGRFHIYQLQVTDCTTLQAGFELKTIESMQEDRRVLRTFCAPEDTASLRVRYRLRYPPNEYGPLMEARIRVVRR